MRRPAPWTRRLTAAGGLLLLLTLTAAGGGEPAPCCYTLDDLAKLDGCQLEALFRAGSVARPFDGTYDGRLLTLTDRFAPRVKLAGARATWRGKQADASTGYFINRWPGGKLWIDSHYVIGPSWIDGKPAVVMEYPPKTPLFEPMHDEIREICPGVWVGPVFERFPCPKFRGWLALQEAPCEPCKPRLLRR